MDDDRTQVPARARDAWIMASSSSAFAARGHTVPPAVSSGPSMAVDGAAQTCCKLKGEGSCTAVGGGGFSICSVRDGARAEYSGSRTAKYPPFLQRQAIWLFPLFQITAMPRLLWLFPLFQITAMPQLPKESRMTLTLIRKSRLTSAVCTQRWTALLWRGRRVGLKSSRSPPRTTGTRRPCGRGPSVEEPSPRGDSPAPRRGSESELSFTAPVKHALSPIGTMAATDQGRIC